MVLTPHEYLLWATGTFLEILACLLAFQRGLFRRLPSFTIYLTLLVAREVLWWWLSHQFGLQTRAAFYSYWIAQGVLLFARGWVITDICLRILQPYRGLWALGRRLLLGIAAILVLNAALSTLERSFWIGRFILHAERGLELAAVGILVALLILCRYYGLRLEPWERMVILGLGFYSGVQAVSNSFIRELLTYYFDWWTAVRTNAFYGAVAIWCLALRKPLPPERPAPLLLSQQVYNDVAPQVSFRLRKLNERLLELLKS